MYDIPLDAWYVWLGLAAASTAALAVAAAIPAVAPPDASAAAETVDRVAASQYDSVASHPLETADEVRVGSDTLSLRGPGGESHARFAYGPVTPVVGDDRLQSVLEGEPPDRVYASASAFDASAEHARERLPEWRQTDRLFVRRISWGDVDVVLAG